MLKYIIWGISFTTLYLSLVWLNVLYIEKNEIRRKRQEQPKYFPIISILIPAYNEGKNIKKTINSILKVNYPKDKIEIIVIDDGSEDDTNRIIRSYKKYGVILLRQKNSGKSSALNNGLKHAKGELIGCVDADSTIEKDSIISMIHHFKDKNVGAVTSGIYVSNAKTTLEKIQRLEYILAAFIRRLMTFLNTVYVTPGVLSLYRKSTLKKLNGFDEGNLTEDLEIALHLHHEGYRIILELDSVTSTKVPGTYDEFKKQRIRWSRGHIHNTLKYKDMLFNRKYGFMGTFQYPLHIITPLILILCLSIIIYSFADGTYDFIRRVIIMKWGFIYSYISFSNMKDTILGLNINILFPLLITTITGIYMFQKAHVYTKKKWKHIHTFFIFLIFYPALLGYFWLISITEEIRKKERKW